MAYEKGNSGGGTLGARAVAGAGAGAVGGVSRGRAPRVKVAKRPVVAANPSSAANRFSKGQRAGYAAMNRLNSRRVAATKARNAAPPPRRTTGDGGLKNYGKPTSGGAIGQAHQSFFDIGAFLRSLGR